MRNMVTGKTLQEFQLELGVAKGYEQFTRRGTGKTLGKAYECIGELLMGNKSYISGIEVTDTSKGVNGSQLIVDMKRIIESNGLVGFTFEMQAGTRYASVSYYPFELEVK